MKTVKPVWLWLPGAIEPIMVGEYQLSESGGRPLGKFHYQHGYKNLPQAMPLDQHQLGRFNSISKTTDYEGLHDIFRDIKPEGCRRGGSSWRTARQASGNHPHLLHR